MKKHAPIEQLKKAGEEAHKKLVARGIATQENAVERLMKEKPDLILPGMPSYIPHHDTIRYSQRMMFDLLRLWKDEHDASKLENLSSFIEFAVTEMNLQESIAKRKIEAMDVKVKNSKKSQTLDKVFEPVNQYETVKAMKKFFVDSFAVCVVVRGKTAQTHEFMNWFLSWSEQLDKIWSKKDDKKRKTEEANPGA